MKIQRVKFKDIEQIPKIKVNTKFKQNFFGSSPTPFIGRYGYPSVNIGVLSPQLSGDTSHYDSPAMWAAKEMAVGEVASLRYGLVNSRQKWNVKKAYGGRFLDICQEVGMAAKPVEMEVNLRKKPALGLKSDSEIKPWGPASSILNARVTANSRVDTRVDRVVSDTDLKAASGVVSLYKKGFEEGSLNKLMSVGNLGVEKNRKLVPTRWSITAVDDTIGKELVKEVKRYEVGDYEVHFGGAWGNYYLLLFFPEIWSYELFETYLNSSVNPWSKNGLMYSTDYEPYKGRKEYASETAGGFYSARLPILEKMKVAKRQYSCVALRFITDEYKVPLGVWVCREAARKSVEAKSLKFGSEKLMMQYVSEFVSRKFNFDISLLLKNSLLLKEKNRQRKLSDF